VVLLVGVGAVIWWTGGDDTAPARAGTTSPAADRHGLAPAAPSNPAGEPSGPVASVGPGDLTSRENPANPTGGGTGPGSAGGQGASTTTNTGAGSALPGDQFAGTTLDNAKWDVYESTDANGGRWTSSAVRVSGGELQIVGTGKNPSGAGNTSGGLCWCGSGGSRTFGIWRVRARFDAGAGYGQAIGLWPVTETSTEQYITFANSSLPDKQKLDGSVSWKGGGSEGVVTGDFTGWHTFAVEWRSTFVKLTVDDKVFYDSTGKSGVVIPQKPMQLFIQQAIGPSSGVTAANSSTPGQVILHVDWVTYQS